MAIRQPLGEQWANPSLSGELNADATISLIVTASDGTRSRRVGSGGEAAQDGVVEWTAAHPVARVNLSLLD
jgi:hypothetical protein